MTTMPKSKSILVNDMSKSETPSRVRPGVITAYSVITVLGAGFFFGSLNLNMYRGEDQVGPAYLPRYAAILLIILGVLLLVQELRGRSVMAGDSGIEEDAAPLTRKTVLKLLTVFGLIIAALLLVPIIGLIGSLVLLIPALTMGVERMPVIPSLVVTAAAAVVAYVIFIVVLRVPLPLGIFEGVLG